MSYRNRFILAKKDCLKMRDMTYEDVLKYVKEHAPDAYNDDDEECPYIEVFNMFNQTEIFEVNDNYVINSVNEHSERFFRKDETNKYFEEAEIHLCTKETFKKAIFALRLSILDYYKSLLAEPKEEYELSVEDKIKAFIAGKINEWELLSNKFGGNEKMKEYDENNGPYNISENVDEIVSSSRYEYLIFEMARLYKTINFDEYCLMFYGW